MGDFVAKIVNGGDKAPRSAFHYWDKGTMATIGRSHAVAMMGGVKFSGYLAWLAWLLVHLLFVIGLRNKVSVLIQWVHSYFRYKRSSRIIFDNYSAKSQGRSIAAE